MTHTTENSKEVLHTKGEWKVKLIDEGNTILIYSPMFGAIATINAVKAAKEHKANAELIVKAVNERQKLLDSIEELSSIAKQCLFLFGNEANYPEGTTGYKLKMKCMSAINNAKTII